MVLRKLGAFFNNFIKYLKPNVNNLKQIKF